MLVGEKDTNLRKVTKLFRAKEDTLDTAKIKS